MKFHIRSANSLLGGNFVEVEIDNTKIDLGLLSEIECQALATELREAAEELWEDDEDMECTYCHDCDEVGVRGQH